MATVTAAADWAIEHEGEDRANELRRWIAECEPLCQRTYTPSLAVIERSAGSYHWTVDGRQLADFTSGVLVANLGHNPTRWWQRLTEYLGLPAQLGSGAYTAAAPLSAYNAITPLEARASKRLLDSLRGQPGGGRCEQVLWAASGSEAIQKALWAAMARKPGADLILATRRGFHGKKGLANAVTGDEHSTERDPRVRFISFPTTECESVARRKQPLNLTAYQAELEALWQHSGERICCLVTEPYLGGGGSYHPQVEYIQYLQAFCREHDILFILDEVQANFGRTGSLYAFTQYGVEPDLVVLGKGLGNGVAVSAVAGRADVFAALNYGDGSDTWSGNPLASAAVLATLDEFEATDAVGQGQALSPVLEAGLLRLLELPIVSHIRGEGVVWGIECKEHGDRSAREIANACVEACYHGDETGRAIHLLGPLAGRVIRVSPPLTFSLSDAAAYLDTLYRCFARVASGAA